MRKKREENGSISKRFHENLFSFMQKHINKRFILAVSGGVDSMVLLDAFLKLSCIDRKDFCVATLDHGIRKESLGELDYIRNFCVENDLSFFGKSVNIPELKAYKYFGCSTEQAAREERREFLFSVKNNFKADFIVTAHHRDDLIETFLLRILRGTGLNGMNCLNGEDAGFIRPLVNFGKKEILQYSADNGIFYFEDITNKDDTYIRNRIRNKTIPYLEKEFTDFKRDILFRDQNNFSDSNKTMEFFFEKIIYPNVNFSFEKALISINFLNTFPDFSKKEILLRIFGKWKKNVMFVDEKKLSLITRLLNEKEVFSIQITKSIFCKAKKGNLFFEEKTVETPIKEFSRIINSFSFGERIEITDPLMDFSVSFEKKSIEDYLFPEIFEKEIAVFDLEKIQFPLELRRIKEGDFFVPSGIFGTKKISRFLGEKGLSSSEKKKQLVLLDKKNDIIWCVAHRISQIYKADKNTRVFLIVKFVIIKK